MWSGALLRSISVMVYVRGYRVQEKTTTSEARRAIPFSLEESGALLHVGMSASAPSLTPYHSAYQRRRGGTTAG